MAKVKYVGKGMLSRGIQFDPTKNDGLYEVDTDTAKYLCDTFSDDFILIEPSTKSKATKKTTKSSVREEKKNGTEAEPKDK